MIELEDLLNLGERRVLRMELLEIIDNLKKGKSIYVGYCLNADINDKEMMFYSDEEAIAFYSNHEADVYKFYKEKGKLKKKLIYERGFRGRSFDLP